MVDREAFRLARNNRIDEYLKEQDRLYKGIERRWRAHSIAENTREMQLEFRHLSTAITKHFPQTPQTERVEIHYIKKGLLVEAKDPSLLPEGVEEASLFLSPSFTSINLGKDADLWIEKEYDLFQKDFPTLPLRHLTIFVFTRGEKPQKIGHLPIARTVSGIPVDTGYSRTFSKTTKRDILALRYLLRDFAEAISPK